MDMAEEQSLTALEMLSKKHNKAILHAFPSCLMYLDFSISAQNKARTNTANCCQGQLLEEYPLASDALPVPVLSSRLIHDDEKSVDTSCLALSRLPRSSCQICFVASFSALQSESSNGRRLAVAPVDGKFKPFEEL